MSVVICDLRVFVLQINEQSVHITDEQQSWTSPRGTEYKKPDDTK